MLARILASVARGEVERKGARQRRANEQRANGGYMGWATRPFGYDRTDGRVVIVKAEAEALQDVARLVLAGSTLASAVRLLDKRGLTTTAGKPWNATSLRRALQSRRYSGRVVYNGADVAGGTWPVILDAETQDRLAEVLRDVRRRLQQSTKAKHLLSGLARCGRCGTALYATKGTGHLTYKCPSCRLARRVSQVDELVTEVVIGRLSQPDAASIFATDADLDELRAEVVGLRDRRDGLAELMADGLLSRDAVAQQAGRLTRRIAEVESRIIAALGDSPVAQLADSVDVAAAWEALDVRARKAVIDALMTVTVLPAGRGARFSVEQVEIEWKTS
jgi:site-specific DNA recombinase